MMSKRIIFTIVLSLLFFQNYAQIKSYKRGVSYGYHSAYDMQKYSENISWWYNWATEPDSAIKTTYQNYNVDFAPMAWNSSGISNVNNWVNTDPNVKYILGFNEPNFKEQANMTPSQAAAAWPSFQAIADSHNLKTVGPAVNYCGNCVSEGGVTYNNPFKYLDDFFTACIDCKVDYIALHWYGSGNSIVGYVDDARKYNKPIWVTEFASWDYSNPVQNLNDQKKYLAGTVNFLERDPDVYRYSWFIGRTNSGPNTYPYIDLYGNDGQLTPLGQLYMDIPVYDPDFKFYIPGRIESEEYYLMSGLFAEITEDADGFLDIGWTDNNDWAEYKINVAESATYNLSVRVAGTNPGIIDFLIDGTQKVSVNTPNTNGWQNWQTVTTKIDLQAGEQMLKMLVKDAGFNINYIEIFHIGYISPNNFKIQGIGETCTDKNNGQILISATENRDYVATINNEVYYFTTSKTLNKVTPGTYNICITDSGASFEQCFNVEIPKALLVKAKAYVNKKNAEIEILQGTGPFIVYVNNVYVLETASPVFNIAVKNGDVINVKTAIECEGVFTEKIDLLNEIVAYPNPTNGFTEIAINVQEIKEIKVELYTSQSQLISVHNYQVVEGKIRLSLEDFPSGIYFAKIGKGNLKNLRVIKI